MTNAQHTPGPWLITNAHIENGEWVIGIASEKQDGTIALVIGSKARSGYAQESIEATSNALLIAAAPELLEALQNLLNGIETGVITSDHDEVFVNAVLQARATIAKATGNAPSTEQAA